MIREMPMEPEISRYIDGLAPQQRPLVERIRKVVLSISDNITEGIKWGNLVFSSEHNICYIQAHSTHVNFGFFDATNLADPEGLLDGTGKKMRHVKVRDNGDIRPATFAGWVEASLG